MRDLSTKPKMIYTSALPKGLPTEHYGKPVEAICFDRDEQVPKGVIVDVETMLVKLMKNKLEAVFEGLDWNLGEMEPAWAKKVKAAKVPKEVKSKSGVKCRKGQGTIFNVETTDNGKELKLVLF
jgi:hypothetical protein